MPQGHMAILYFLLNFAMSPKVLRKIISSAECHVTSVRPWKADFLHFLLSNSIHASVCVSSLSLHLREDSSLFGSTSFLRL
jgi:hypothetical protein